MPMVHLYLSNDLYDNWQKEFGKGKLASRWFQDIFENYLKTKVDLSSLKKELIEKQSQIEKSKLNIEDLRKLIEDLSIAEEKRRKREKKEEKVLEKLEPNQVINMAKNLQSNLSLSGENEARRLAIDYLSNWKLKGLTLAEFIKNQKIEIGGMK